MRFSSMASAALVALLSFDLHAQNEKAAVMQAAALFIKDSLPAGPVVLEFEGAAANSTEADNAARALGATKGRAASVISCTDVSKGGQRARLCTSAGKAVVVQVESPFVLGPKAQIAVTYSHETLPGRVDYTTYELEFRKGIDGVWRFAKVLSIGGT